MTAQIRLSVESQILDAVSKLIPTGYKFSFFLSKDERKSQKRIAEEIRFEVCDYFNMNPSQIFRKTRKSEIVLVRKFVCLFLKEHTSFSLTQIAKFAGYDVESESIHANALKAINALKGWIETDDKIAYEYKELTKIINDNVLELEPCEDLN